MGVVRRENGAGVILAEIGASAGDMEGTEPECPAALADVKCWGQAMARRFSEWMCSLTS